MEYLNIKKTKDLFTNKLQSKRYRFYYYLSISLVTILVFIIFAIYPTVSEIFQELNTISIINVENQQMQNRYNDINSTYSQYSKIINPNKYILSKSLPNNKNTGFVFANIYQILNNNNLNLNNISFNSSSNLSNISKFFPFITGISSFNVSISATGSYQSFLSSLSTLSKYPQKILIYNSSFSPNTNISQSSSGVSSSNMFQSQGNISFDALVFYY